MAAKGSTSRPATNASGVRRNLFHHHLSRRPTSTSTSSSVTTQQDSTNDEANEVIAKDSNGAYVFRIPILPPLDEERMQEEEMGRDRESLEAKMLSEMYKERSLHNGDTNELMAAVQISLKRKVASLDEDKWMFEAEQASQEG